MALSLCLSGERFGLSGGLMREILVGQKTILGPYLHVSRIISQCRCNRTSTSTSD